ncbi:MAG: TonB-dependent receptor [Bdellovibrionota bacterium]|nr:TonB-dependent receptor [Bdellovibrionota bacterium]
MDLKIALTLMAVAPSALLAQTSTADLSDLGTNETTTTGEASADSRYEKVEVTGSYIKRVDLEGAQSVQTLDRDYLDKTGYNSVGDVMRDLTASSFGGARESSGSATAGTATVSLRGLGANRTLILLNGRRMAKDGIGAATDLNLIPMAAVERIDVLKTGGSATYGSDAVGGVVNVITRKNFVGAEINMRQEITELEGGNRTTISGVYGTAGSKGSIMGSIQYRKNEVIFDRDREFSEEGSSVNAPIPSILYNGGLNAVQGCSDIRDDGACNYNFADFSTGLPEIEQFNALTNASYNIDSMTELHAQVSATRKETTWNYAPGVVAFRSSDNFTAPRDITLADGTVIPAGTQLNYVGWRSEALGTRDTEVTTNSVAVNAGIKRYIGDSWEADFTVGTERIKREEDSVNGYALKDGLTALIQNGSCDIFGGDLSGCNDPSIKYNPFQETTSRIDTYELRTNGELFDLPAGPLSAALGGQVMYETYAVNADEQSVLGNVTGGGTASPGSGTRHVTAIFGELAIPITDKLESQVSGRYDKYSDFGDTFNPQVNFRYKPIPELLFRASAGTGFKAPDMQDLYAAQGFGYPTFIDQFACANGGSCRPEQWETFSGGNRNLTEETSESWNIGMVAEPSKMFSVAVDYYSIKLENTVGTDLEAITQAELQGVDISQYGVQTNRDPSSGRLLTLTAPTLNLASTEVQGIDLNLRFSSQPRAWGDLIVTNNTSYMTKYDITKFPGLAPESVLDNDPGAPQWRNNLNVDYGVNEKLRIATSFRTIGSNFKSDPTAGKTPVFTQIDMQASLAIPSWGSKVSLGVVNLLNDFPELDETSQSSKLNASLYDPIGRRFFAAYTQSF